MNENILILIIVLVAVNLILITVAVVRSMLRRDRRRSTARTTAVSRVGRSRPVSRRRIAPPVQSELTSSRTDSLTGLLVAKEWNRIVADEDARVNRYRHPATVVIIELDGFDRLVANLGREAGDRILPALADTLSRNARGADHLARIGPDALRDPAPRDGRGRGDQLHRARPRGLRPVARIGRDRAPPLDRLGESRPETSLAVAVGPRPGADVRRAAPARSGSRTTSSLSGPPPVHDIGGSPSRLACASAPQSRPVRRPRPGVAPVCTPSATTSVPATMTCSMPTG